MWPFTALPLSWIAKNYYLFYVSNISLNIMLPKGNFEWFVKIYWEEILIKHQNIYILTILVPKYDLLPPYPGPYILCCLKVFVLGGTGGFIGKKCWLNTKIPIFWQFRSQNVTLYRPTLVMNSKKSLLFFTLPIFPKILCWLKCDLLPP